MPQSVSLFRGKVNVVPLYEPVDTGIEVLLDHDLVRQAAQELGLPAAHLQDDSLDRRHEVHYLLIAPLYGQFVLGALVLEELEIVLELVP